MKKVFVFFLALMFAVTLTACASRQEEKKKDRDGTPVGYKDQRGEELAPEPDSTQPDSTAPEATAHDEERVLFTERAENEETRAAERPTERETEPTKKTVRDLVKNEGFLNAIQPDEDEDFTIAVEVEGDDILVVKQQGKEPFSEEDLAELEESKDRLTESLKENIDMLKNIISSNLGISVSQIRWQLLNSDGTVVLDVLN